MSQLTERIAQFRKMAQDDPDNELGHFRLGQLLLEDGQAAQAAQSFRRTLELSPQFSKVYQLLGQCLIQLDKPEEAVETLQKGFRVADERGDNVPKEEMAKLLRGLNAEVPTATVPAQGAGGAGGGFRCQRPGCQAGGHARPLDKAPLSDDIGERVRENICADCWNEWLRVYSVKLINELRLDLSREEHVAMYDQYMKEFFGLA